MNMLAKSQTAEYQSKSRSVLYVIISLLIPAVVMTLAVIAVWIISIPVWKPFMTYVLQFGDVDKLFGLVLMQLGFYALYAFQNVFDAEFYGLGKTEYMLFESIVTNTVYYGIAFILYLKGIWVPTLTGIALMFGIGMAFDSLVSLGAYIYLRRRL